MRAVIEPFAQQSVAQFDDQLDCGLRQPGWAGLWAARPRLKRFLAFQAVRATSRLIQPCQTPYSRATSDWLRPSTTTAVMTKRAFDTRRQSAAQAILMSCDTLCVCPGTRHCPRYQ